jgi:hypothetical protein
MALLLLSLMAAAGNVAVGNGRLDGWMKKDEEKVN